MINKAAYLEEVRDQYENYPYPPRDPENEKKALTRTALDNLEQLNYYCFEGKSNFDNGFRVLVAGGGTGDATIFLAEQLRGKDAQIVHLDMSEASIAIAKERAVVRGLDNITWVHQSLLELPQMDIEKFDYINSSGVLHHLDDPSAGLNSLKSVLKPNGAIGLMVYAKYGRTGIYQMQSLMRLINEGNTDMQEKVDACKIVMNSLPDTNWFKRTSGGAMNDSNRYGDVGIYDLLLHSQDRPYSVPELYEWVESCGLILREMVSGPGISKNLYDPASFVGDKDLLAEIKTKNRPEQQAIAELMVGAIGLHSCYLSFKERSVPALNNLDYIPFFTAHLALDGIYQQFYNAVKQYENSVGAVIKMNLGYQNASFEVKFQSMKHHANMFRFMDGVRSLREIFDEVIKASDENPADDDLVVEFAEIFAAFDKFDLMYLRHKDTMPPKTFKEMTI